jgi:transcription termination/antitermination protein NusG
MVKNSTEVKSKKGKKAKEKEEEPPNETPVTPEPEQMKPQEPVEEGEEKESSEQEDAAIEEGEEGKEPEEVKDPDRKWYVIHTYSGYENKVRANLLRRIDSMGMKDKIFQVLVPTEEEIEFKDGKRRTVQKKIYPGYVLVEMIMKDDSWYVVRNTSGVTGFVGPGVKPIPLPEEEVKTILRHMGLEAPVRVKIDLSVGQGVRVTHGPFQDFHGIVEEVNPERGKVKVLITIFGRETPVELEFAQVEKL